MTIQWYNNHILWKDGHIAHDPNCCCDPGPCCCCCTCYDFQFRFDYEGQTYYPTTKVCRTSDGIWTSQNSEWQLTRTGNNRYTLAGTNPPVTFQFPGPMAPPNAGPCPAPAIGWGFGETPAGGSWTILLAACNTDCSEYDQTYTVSAHIKAMYASGIFQPPYDTLLFEGDFSGTLSKVPGPIASIHYHTGCVWQGDLTVSNLSGTAPYAPTAILSRDECGWWLEMGGGYPSQRCHAVHKCSNTSHAICDSPIGAFDDYETPCGLTAPSNYMWVSNIRVTGPGDAPATTTATMPASASVTSTIPVAAPSTATSATFPRSATAFAIPDNALDICHACGSGSCMSYCRGCGGGTIVAPCPAGRW